MICVDNKTMIRPVMMYGAEAWTLRRKEEKLLERTEMRMLRWILGISLKDTQRNENIRKKIGVACITEKIREARLRCTVRTCGAIRRYQHQKSNEVGSRPTGTSQPRKAKEEMDGHDSRGPEISRPETRRHREKRRGGRGSEWLTPRRRGINSSLKEKKKNLSVFS